MGGVGGILLGLLVGVILSTLFKNSASQKRSSSFWENITGAKRPGSANFGPNPMGREFFPQAFYSTFFGLLAKVAKADGHVDQAEARYIRNMVASLFPNIDPAFIKKKFNEARDNDKDYRLYANTLDSLLVNQPDLRQMVLCILCDIVSTDHKIHPKELEILLYVENLFKLHGYVHAFFNTDSRGKRTSSNATAEPSTDKLTLYREILEVSPHATRAEIKQAYRKKCKAYHPDKLQGQGASPTLIAQAQKEMQKINLAYDELLKTCKE